MKDNRGALLLEVLLGFSLFMTALLFSFGVFPNSAKASAQSRDYTIARSLARDYLEQELVKNYTAIVTSGPIFEPRIVNTDGKQISKNFQVDTEVTILDDTGAGDAIDRKHVKVTVRWNINSDLQREVFLETWVTQ